MPAATTTTTATPPSSAAVRPPHGSTPRTPGSTTIAEGSGSSTPSSYAAVTAGIAGTVDAPGWLARTGSGKGRGGGGEADAAGGAADMGLTAAEAKELQLLELNEEAQDLLTWRAVAELSVERAHASGMGMQLKWLNLFLHSC